MSDQFLFLLLILSLGIGVWFVRSVARAGTMAAGREKPAEYSLGKIVSEELIASLLNSFSVNKKFKQSYFYEFCDCLVSLKGFYIGQNYLANDEYEPFLIFLFQKENKFSNGFVAYFECKDYWSKCLYGKINKYESYAEYSDELYSLKLIDSLMMVKLQSCFVQSSLYGVLIGFPCKFYNEGKKLELYKKAKEMFSALEVNNS